MSRVAAVAAVAAVALAATSPAAAQTATEPDKLGVEFFDTGPLRIREPFLLSVGYLAFEPESADMLGPGEWQIDLVHSVTNTWVRSLTVERFLEERTSRAPLTLAELRAIPAQDGDDGAFHADGEVARTSLALRRGFGDALQVAVTVPMVELGGGFMDDMIESSHDTFGFEQSGRTGVPVNDYSVYFRSDGTEVFRTAEAGRELGDVTAAVKWRLPVRDPAWRLALEGVVKLATGDEERLHSSGSEDYGLQLLVTRYWTRSVVHLSLGVLRLGEHRVLGTSEQTTFSGLVAYEYRVGRTSTVVLQLGASESPFHEVELDQLSRVAYLVDVGIKKGWGEHTVLFFAISENVVNFGNSADLGGHLGLTFTW